MLKRSITYQLASIAEDGIGKATRIFESRFGWNVYEIRVLRLIRATPGITFTALAAASVAQELLALYASRRVSPPGG